MKISSKHNALGKTGEHLAERFLQKKGYRILEKNFRSRHGEIDLIAEKDEFLVFVEVKTRYVIDEEDPIFRVDKKKQRHLGSAANAYLASHNTPHSSVRFDVVTVQFEKGKPVFRHYEDAFWLEP
ncbi:MAG: YraN family protein [Calditrichaeota bacterium]|nr:YraN family protein [Calditrichota bacterium]